jgi:hypothetical protein
VFAFALPTGTGRQQQALRIVRVRFSTMFKKVKITSLEWSY